MFLAMATMLLAGSCATVSATTVGECRPDNITAGKGASKNLKSCRPDMSDRLFHSEAVEK